MIGVLYSVTKILAKIQLIQKLSNESKRAFVLWEKKPDKITWMNANTYIRLDNASR